MRCPDDAYLPDFDELADEPDELDDGSSTVTIEQYRKGERPE